MGVEGLAGWLVGWLVGCVLAASRLIIFFSCHCYYHTLTARSGVDVFLCRYVTENIIIAIPHHTRTADCRFSWFRRLVFQEWVDG